MTVPHRCRANVTDMDEDKQNTPEPAEPSTGRSPRGVPVRAARIVGVLLTLAIIAGAVGWVRFTHIVPAEGPGAYVDVHPGDSVTAISQWVFDLGMTSFPRLCAGTGG
ncbi:MAG: hypothetical protein NT102_03730 [Caldiserica bacterium]|nr:hypothetical protein [Caldisericota bacterium]